MAIERSTVLITVKVRTILTLKRILGSGELEFNFPEGTTLESLLSTLVDRWGEELAAHLFEPNSRTLRSYIRLMVNGRDIAFLDRLETQLHDGDDVLMLPPVSGG